MEEDTSQNVIHTHQTTKRAVYADSNTVKKNYFQDLSQIFSFVKSTL